MKGVAMWAASRPALPRLAAAALALGVAGGLLAAPSTAHAGSSGGDYIVVLEDSVPSPGAVAAEHRRAHGAEVTFSYQHALKGYAARLSGRALAEVRSDPRVAYVEPDGVVHASATTQSNPTWGLDRVDQRSLPLDTKYVYSETGAGVTAYVVDSGIRPSHSEFGGRARFGFDAFGQNGPDCNGHGTHVAGTIGGTQYGVAKAVQLVSVRVLNCSGSGTWSGVIAGVDWVTANATKPAVANMSLGGGASSSVDAAVRNSIASGVSYAVAAGNGNMAGVAQNACNYSPARTPEAMTIGATTNADAKTSWSNYGACVDWFAPGSSITSAWYSSDTDTRTISGTSMAAPHTAGAAALHLQKNPGASAAQVRDALFALTTKGIVSSSKTANNHLLHTGPAAQESSTPVDGGGGTKIKGASGKQQA
jgi:subtilisin family serine protease